MNRFEVQNFYILETGLVDEKKVTKEIDTHYRGWEGNVSVYKSSVRITKGEKVGFQVS